jgi:hypothetical protein
MLLLLQEKSEGIINDPKATEPIPVLILDKKVRRLMFSLDSSSGFCMVE